MISVIASDMKLILLILSIISLTTFLEKSGVLITASQKISNVSESTTETVNQVSEAIQSVSIGASGQAESTQKATSEVELLASKLHETKAYVSDINDMSVETKQLSDQGLTIVDDLIEIFCEAVISTPDFSSTPLISDDIWSAITL